MVTFCAHCGYRVRETEGVTCPSCGQTIAGREKKPGFFSRLLRALFVPAGPPRRGETRTVQVLHRQEFTWVDPETGAERTVNNLDDLPPDVRSRVMELTRELRDGPTSGGNRFTYRAPDGSEQTYRSLEEMPPDVRRLFDRARPGD